MKTLLSLFLLLALGASAATGIKISEYPNTPVLTNSELFIVAVTNVTPATNRNISYGQLRSLLSSNNFVGSFTGDGRNASNVVAAAVSGTLSNNIAGNAGAATNLLTSVIFYGAVGDGSVDDTTAFLKAMTNGSVYVPAGTYKVNSLTNFSPCKIYGDGQSSVLLAQTIGVVQNSDLELQNLTISGGSTTGLVALADFNTFVVNVLFTNHIRGVILDGPYSSIPTNKTTFQNIFVTHCDLGVSVGEFSGGGEYSSFFGSTISSNALGLLVRAGNVLVEGNRIDNNTQAFIIGESGNGGHSTYMGNSFNHCAVPSIITNTLNSLSFIANQVWYCSIYVTNCAINFSHNTFGTAAIRVKNTPGTDVVLDGNFWAPGGTFVSVDSGPIASVHAENNFGVSSPRLDLSKTVIGQSWTTTADATDSSVDMALISTNINAVESGGTLGLGYWDGTYRVVEGAIRGNHEGSGYKGGLALFVNDGSLLRKAAYLDSSSTLTVSNNISASGSVIATNAFIMPPVSAGPVWCTNGLAAIWNSNTTVYIRTSAVGATTFADKLMAP